LLNYCGNLLASNIDTRQTARTATRDQVLRKIAGDEHGSDQAQAQSAKNIYCLLMQHYRWFDTSYFCRQSASGDVDMGYGV
jgi:hypothetical protein